MTPITNKYASQGVRFLASVTRGGVFAPLETSYAGGPAGRTILAIISARSRPLADNAVKMHRVLDAIRAAGVPDRDVRTNAVRIAARYDYAAQVRTFSGYVASNTVGVLLHDVGAVGPFLDRMTAAGATQIDGPTFNVDQPGRYRVAARDRALARAGAEAQAYAQRAGFRTARLLSVTEGAGFVQPYDIVVTGSSRSYAAAPPAPRVSTETLGGQQSIGVTITAIYRLER